MDEEIITTEAEMTEEQWYDALGVNKGEKEPEDPQPAEAEEEGEKDQADPEPEESAEEVQPMSKEDRHKNAARRREAEKQAAIEEAVKAEREKMTAEVDAVYAGLGIRDKYHDGKEIRTKADYEEYKAAERAEIRARALKKFNISEEEAEVLGFSREEMKSAQEAREAEEDQPFSGGEKEFAEQLKEIGRMDASVKTLQDLASKPFAKEMLEEMNAGHFGKDAGRLVRAYKAFSYDSGSAHAKEAGAQEVRNQQAGKAHLAPAKEGGADAAEVPPEVIREYRRFFPDWTAEKIRKQYAADQKKVRR